MTFDKNDKLDCTDTAWPVFSPVGVWQGGGQKIRHHGIAVYLYRIWLMVTMIVSANEHHVFSLMVALPKRVGKEIISK